MEWVVNVSGRADEPWQLLFAPSEDSKSGQYAEFVLPQCCDGEPTESVAPLWLQQLAIVNVGKDKSCQNHV